MASEHHIDCQHLINAIDAYIEKADDNLSDSLDAEGYAKPKKTLTYIQDIEAEVTDALLDETDYIVSEAERAIDLESFAKDIWPNVKLNDTVARMKLFIARCLSNSIYRGYMIGFDF